MRFQLLTSLVSLSLLWSPTARAVNVSIPLAPPSTSQPLSSTLVSFSIEQDRWPEWTGIKSRNEFTFNAFDNYAKLTGHPPKLRVGADSADRTTWSPNVDIVEATFPSSDATTPYPEASSILVGDGFYELIKFLPPGTVMTWDVNFGANNITNAVNMAKAIVKAFDSPAAKEAKVTLSMIEIGNEVDIYPFTNHRGSDWSVEEYVPQWEANAGPIAEAVGLKNGGVTFQGGPFGVNLWHPEQIYDLGILDSAPGKLITTFAQHRYSVTSNPQTGDAALASFLNKANIRSNLTLWQEDIAATKQRGLRYILGETGNAAFHGVPGISNTAGMALWATDYALQAATLGIDELFFHEGIGYKYNFLQPVALNRSILDSSPLNTPQPPHIMPSYYAGILVNTFIGNSGSAKVVELPVSDDNVSGYAVYEGNTLKRAVFINLNAWLLSSTGARPSVHVDLSFSGSLGSNGLKATARRLVIGHADDTEGLTFAGQSFETNDARPVGSITEEKVDIGKGLEVRSTEAVLLSF